MNGINQPQTGMRLFDGEGRRLYFTEEERRAFIAAAAKADPSGKIHPEFAVVLWRW